MSPAEPKKPGFPKGEDAAVRGRQPIGRVGRCRRRRCGRPRDAGGARVGIDLIRARGEQQTVADGWRREMIGLAPHREGLHRGAGGWIDGVECAARHRPHQAARGDRRPGSPAPRRPQDAQRRGSRTGLDGLQAVAARHVDDGACDGVAPVGVGAGAQGRGRQPPADPAQVRLAEQIPDRRLSDLEHRPVAQQGGRGQAEILVVRVVV